MHELAIAHSILDIAVAAAEKAGARRIMKVNVVAGQLRGILPLQLTFWFGILAEGTLAQDACLNLEITPMRGRCRECAQNFIVEDYRHQCPQCGSRDIQSDGGTELRLSDIEVE